MRHVPRQQDIAILDRQQVRETGRVIRLHPATRRELGQGVTRAPVRLGGLSGAQLSAVPDNVRADCPAGRQSSQRIDLPSTEGGERPLGINLRPHCLTVVRKVDEHRMGGYSTRSMV